MKRMKRWIVPYLGTLASLLPLPACAGSLTYSAEAIEAKVIDADTKRPIKGVVVVANWQLEQGTAGGNIPAGQLMVMETVTDEEGRFAFSAWGPKSTQSSFLVNDDPQLLLFKSGYEYRRLSNPYSSKRELRLRPMRRSVWNGRTIVLKPFKGTMKEYAKHLGFFETSLDNLLDEDCAWKRIPSTVLIVSKQSEIFRTEGLYALPSIESLDVRYKNFESECGSVKEFFRSYKP